MGFKMLANTDPLIGVNKEILQASVSKVEEIFEQKLVDSGRREECEKKQVIFPQPGSNLRTTSNQLLHRLHDFQRLSLVLSNTSTCRSNSQCE